MIMLPALRMPPPHPYNECMNNDAIRRLIIALPDALDYDALTQSLADDLMTLARMIDPTESDAAAYLRDALRDNTELSI